MKRSFKALSLLLTVVLLLGLTGGALASELPYVELTMYLVGDKPEGVDDVYAQINEILKEKINATIKAEWLSWSEEATKYSLLFSSGEDFDMIFTASQWCHFEQTVGLGGFAALSEDLLKTCAPDVWAAWPKDAWKQATINGEIYMIPANFVQVNQDVIALRGDLLTKYGFEDVASYDQMIAFFEACAADGIYGLADGGAAIYWLMFESLGYYTVGGTPSSGQLVLYNYSDLSDTKFTYVMDWEPFVAYCHEMKKLADAGCWPSDVMNAVSDRQDGLLTGRGAGMVWNSGSCAMYANEANKTHPEWAVNLHNIMPGVKSRSTAYVNGGIGFNAASANLERAVMAYNVLATDPAAQDLAQLGIEGVHWTKSGDEHYKLTDTPYTASNYWGWRNNEIMRTVVNENPTAVDLKQYEIDDYCLAHVAEKHPLDGFTFNQESVTTQCAAIDAIQSTYLNPLMNGLVADVDATLAEYKAALEYAGIKDVLTELQRQIDEYLTAE